MDRLEAVEDEIYNNNIDIVEYNDLSEISMIIKDNEYCEAVSIIINKLKVENDRELLVALSHELGHYNTSTYYNPYMLISYKWKMEYEANFDSISRLVPIVKLEPMLIDGWKCSRYELAEEFHVPEDFIDEAIHMYKRKGLLPERGE